MEGIKDFDLVPGSHPDEEETGPSWWFLFHKRAMLMTQEDGQGIVPLLTDPSELGIELGETHYLGRVGGHGVRTASIAEPIEPAEGYALFDQRSLFSLLTEAQVGIAGRALHVLDWSANHKFCGRCGAPTKESPTERAKLCTDPDCFWISYPVIAPAVIVAVRRDDKVLLARSPRFPGEMYSTLAGFSEPGERLEETVKREIFEEVGIEVDRIEYFDSQPWPFPNSLMIGFTACWAGGEIEIDGEEIEAAGWFGYDDLPRLPAPYSIARRLIEDFIERFRG